MAEETEDGDDELKGGRSPSSPLPPNPSLHPNLKRKPGDPYLPGLSDCHSCGIHFPPKSQTDKLQILDSQWRVVLLCESCIAAVHSAQSCSYCFSMITTSDQDPHLTCRFCSRRVHPRCAADQIRPDPFTCIDCCPYIVPHRRNRVAAAASTSSLEGLVKDTDSTKKKKAAKEKEKAAKKAAAAKEAAKHASSAPVAVAKVPAPPPKELDDEELAIQLHLAINGSRRISRSRSRSRSADVNCSIGSKKTQSGNSVSKSQSGDFSNCEKVEVSTEEKISIEKQNSSIRSIGSKKTQSGNSVSKYQSGDFSNCEKVEVSTEEKNSIEKQKTSIQLVLSEVDHDKGADLGVVLMDAGKGVCNQSSWGEGETNETEKGVCNQSSWREGETNENTDQKKEPVKQEHESCDQSSTIELPNENPNHMNVDDDECDKSMLVDVPVKEEPCSCDESSSNERDADEMGIDGGNNDNLVDIPVVVHYAFDMSSSINFSSNTGKDLTGEDLTEGVHGHCESNLIDVPVKQVARICNHSSSSELDTDEEPLHGYDESNLVDIPVKSCPTAVSHKRTIVSDNTTALLESELGAEADSSRSKKVKTTAPTGPHTER